MIKVFIHIARAVIAAVVALLVSSCGLDGGKKLDGSGTMITQNRGIKEDFSSIKAGNGLEIVIEQGGERSVTVEADDNLQQHIKTVVENGKLEISSDVNISSAKAKRVIIRVAELENIEVEGGATITNRNVFKSQSLDLVAGGGSTIDIKVDVADLSCESESGSTIKVSGKAENLTAEAAGGSSVNAKGLTAISVEAEASGGGSTYVNPVEDLSAKASSGGNVYYVNTPENLDKKTSSGGGVSQE